MERVERSRMVMLSCLQRRSAVVLVVSSLQVSGLPGTRPHIPHYQGYTVLSAQYLVTRTQYLLLSTHSQLMIRYWSTETCS